MNGHTYSRAVPAHTIVDEVLGKIISSMIEIDEAEEIYINSLINDIGDKETFDKLNDASLDMIN